MSSSSDELPERRPLSSSFAGPLGSAPSFRALFVLALDILLSWEHAGGGDVVFGVDIEIANSLMEQLDLINIKDQGSSRPCVNLYIMRHTQYIDIRIA